MNELLTRRTDRPLPPGAHEKLRADLLSAIETEPVRAPRRILAPALAAASVLVVVAGLVVAVRAMKTDSAPPVSGTTKIRTLSAEETATLRTQCLAEANRITSKSLPHPFTDYKVIRAFEFTGVKDSKVVNTWLVGSGLQVYPTGPKGLPPKSDPAYWLCSRTAGGVISEPSIRFGTGARLIGAPIMRIARNAGVYTKSVTRITVQPKGQAPVEAFLQDGFWFAPTVGRTNWGPYDSSDNGLNDFVVRGYDAAGALIVTERGIDPTAAPATCAMVQITLPNGKEDMVPKTPTPPECREYRWPS
ncbi:hypothetical protein OHA18_24910 [Kribbella sp. NBC_00709]|uniref:hypothetical protein n=1 Tax=Kribbella sp. NBC_00709 TaxID=2975972 RepID=UPI002E295256|nr:hypothetical protein [Kribbella sp. NBC_00709]